MIRATAIRVERGGRTLLALDDVALRPGELFGVLGPNGAGKSTLLRVLAGEILPDAGEVRVEGLPLRAWPARRLATRRAVLPQASRLALPLKAEQVVALGRIPHGGGETTADLAAVMQAMREADALGFRGRWFDTLSGGEQQRVHLARVFAQLHGTPPERTALLLDEPTSALDWPQQHAMLAAARARAKAGASVLVVLHDIAQAMRYCDRMLLLAAGRPVAEGPPRDALTEATIATAYGAPVRRIADSDGTSVFVPA
jgi:iron complex transport system ATP-binding protein